MVSSGVGMSSGSSSVAGGSGLGPRDGAASSSVCEGEVKSDASSIKSSKPSSMPSSKVGLVILTNTAAHGRVKTNIIE